MIRSELCALLGIDYPIFQGGMAWIADGRLAAAVSNGGGVGIISSVTPDIEHFREQIRLAKSLTDRPLGANIMLQSRMSEAAAAIAAEEGVAVVTTGAGVAGGMMRRWLDAGIKVIPVVASVAMAKMAQRAGAAAVIAEGQESGGHIGELTTMTLVPQVCDSVSIPVLAAGGIADGRGIAASFMLGAAGVQLGTRFLVAEECGVNQNYKDMVLKANDISTVAVGRRFGGNVCRCIKNGYSRDFAKAEYAPEATAESVAELSFGALRRAVEDGDMRTGCVLAGQAAGLVKKQQPAAEIIRGIFAEAETLLRGTAWVK